MEYEIEGWKRLGIPVATLESPEAIDNHPAQIRVNYTITAKCENGHFDQAEIDGDMGNIVWAQNVRGHDRRDISDLSSPATRQA